jgi:hypothetical protein
VAKGNVIVRISPNNFSAYENKIGMTMQMKFTISVHTPILITVCSQYKGTSKLVRLPDKKMTPILLELGFIKFAEHHFCTQPISDCTIKQSLGEVIAR